MAKTFDQCGDDVKDLASAVMYANHPRLIDAGVTVEYLFAADLKFRGYPAAMVVKIMSLEDRTAGSKDVRIKIDYQWWKDATDAEKRAAFDHECTHLLPVFKRKKTRKKGDAADLDPPSEYKTDNIGRPVLKMRLHDAQLGVFFEVIERHGDDAIDLHNIVAVNKELRERKLVQSQFWG